MIPTFFAFGRFIEFYPYVLKLRPGASMGINVCGLVCLSVCAKKIPKYQISTSCVWKILRWAVDTINL